MTLPITFAGLSSATGADLDGNFSALGALTAIPCSVTGTNSLTLTPLENTPNVTAYSNYMPFSGIAASTNSGAVTATVGSIGARNVYKDTASGPRALTGGEITAGTYFVLAYDSTLNGGAGGFHLHPSISPVTRLSTTVASLTFTALAPGASQDQTVSIAGAATNDNVAVGLPASVVAGVVYDGRVSASGVVSVRATNCTSGTVTPTGGSYRVTVEGFT